MKFNKICVLGGSGFVGTALVSELAARGKQVKVLTRRREHAKGLILLPTVEVVEADIHDERVLAREFRGCDAVINLVGILHENTKGRVDKPQARRGDFHKNHVELPRKAISACAEAGIARFLHMSALGADPTSRSAYQRSKGTGEALVWEAGWQAVANPGTLAGAKFTARRGLQVTIFRPSVIFGPGDSFLNLFARLLKLLPAVPLACPEARFQPVFVGDVTTAFADSTRVGDPAKDGEPYPLLVVRPNGAVAYAMARSAMKSWEDEFGYELVDADMRLEFPPADPELEQLLVRTMKDARQRQTVLAAAMPSRYKSSLPEGLVASPNGGFVAQPFRDDTSSVTGRNSPGFGGGWRNVVRRRFWRFVQRSRGARFWRGPRRHIVGNRFNGLRRTRKRLPRQRRCWHEDPPASDA